MSRVPELRVTWEQGVRLVVQGGYAFNACILSRSVLTDDPMDLVVYHVSRVLSFTVQLVVL